MSDLPDTGPAETDGAPKSRERLGRYIQLVLLGAGGMGSVYRAYDPQLERMVAIKLMHDRSPSFVARFRREARAMARLSHPRVAQIYDFGEDSESGSPYIVMELVTGESLGAVLTRRGRLPAKEVLAILTQAAEGLATAHEQGIIHRDIKPANMVMDERGGLKLVDFGIARMEEGADALTRPQSLLGTPHYMAPELLTGRTADERSDLYALGLTAYHLLSGRLPFEASSAVAVAMKQISEALPPLTEVAPEVPPALQQLISKMIAKDRSARISTAREVLSRLSEQPEPSQPSRPAHSSHLLAIATGCILLGGLGAAGLWLLRRPGGHLHGASHDGMHDAGPALDTKLPPKGGPDAARGTAQVQRPVGPPQLAVLAFKNLSTDPQLDFLSEGMAETVVTNLAGLPIKLLERTQVEGALKEIDFGQTRYVDPQTRAALGRIVGAQWAIQGGYQRSGGQLRVTARLVAIESGEIIDTLVVTRPHAATFALQDAVAREVRLLVQRRLTPP